MGDWAYEYSQEDHPGLLPSAGEILDRAPGMSILLKVWPAPDVMATFRFYSAEAIDFDVDLRESQGQEPLDALCAFFRAIGGSLGKPVVMTFEGTSGLPMIGYDIDRDRVIRLADHKPT